jgi:hypothetical protein
MLNIPPRSLRVCKYIHGVNTLKNNDEECSLFNSGAKTISKQKSSIYVASVPFDLDCSMFTGVSFSRYIITCHVECRIPLNPIGWKWNKTVMKLVYSPTAPDASSKRLRSSRKDVITTTRHTKHSHHSLSSVHFLIHYLRFVIQFTFIFHTTIVIKNLQN